MFSLKNTVSMIFAVFDWRNALAQKLSRPRRCGDDPLPCRLDPGDDAGGADELAKLVRAGAAS